MTEVEAVELEIRRRIDRMAPETQRIVFDHAVVARRIASTPEGVLALALVASELATSPNLVDHKSGLPIKEDSDSFTI